jgi:hypothetical protein
MGVDALGANVEVRLEGRVDRLTDGPVDRKTVGQMAEKRCGRAAQGDGVEIASVHEGGTWRALAFAGRTPGFRLTGEHSWAERASTIGARKQTEHKLKQT